MSSNVAYIWIVSTIGGVLIGFGGMLVAAVGSFKRIGVILVAMGGVLTVLTGLVALRT